jgi:hypothetical protein
MRTTDPDTEWRALDELVRVGSPKRSLTGIKGRANHGPDSLRDL